jgi:hypothetical protein
MDPAAPQPRAQGFLRAVGYTLRHGGVRNALVMGTVWLLLRNLALVGRVLRAVGRHTTAERLERDLEDPETLVQDLVAGRSRAGPPSAADVGRGLIDELGMPEAVDEAEEEAVATGADLEPPVAEAADRKPAAAEAPPVSANAWLTRLKEKEGRELDLNESRRARHVRREALLFRVLLFVAIVAAGLAGLGVVLILAGFVPVGVVSAATAILPGAGTVLIRDLWKHERERRDAAEAARSEYAAVLEATEWALSLDDEGERSRQARAIAERLQERAFAR